MFVRRESFREFLRRYPFLSLIIAVNIAVFIYTALRFGVNDSFSLVYFAGIVPETVMVGQYWRFFTYAFLHDGFMHLIMNMFFLIVIAPPLERIIGHLRMMLLFVFSVASTSLLVYTAGTQYGVGASGFAYGVLGLFLYIVLHHKDFIDPDSRKIVLIWMAIGWAGTLIIPGISFYGHLGGFIGGFLFGLIGVNNRASLRSWRD